MWYLPSEFQSSFPVAELHSTDQQMFSGAVTGSSICLPTKTKEFRFLLPLTTIPAASSCIRFRTKYIKQSIAFSAAVPVHESSIHYDSLRVLEWDKLCDLVASFATTSLGREATRALLWSPNHSYDESLSRLNETNAAVELKKHGGCSLDFSSVNVSQVKSAIEKVRRGQVDGIEAMAVAAMLEVAETLKLDLKVAIKDDSGWYKHFMPLTQEIIEMVTNQPLMKLIQQIIDADGSVKDSASSALKQSREQVRVLERKLYQLMNIIIKNEANETSSLETSIVDGRWCIKSQNQMTSFQALLLSSDPGAGNFLEPLSAIKLNDELQQARALTAKAENNVLLMLTEKMKMVLSEIEELLTTIIRLDVINARATYGLSFGGTCPALVLPHKMDGSFGAESHISGNKIPTTSHFAKTEWTIFLPNAFHPLLLQQHRSNLQKARNDINKAATVTELEKAHPVPVDFYVACKTKVLVITGPNAGGKTICLKTVGLAAMMAKSGLHILCSKPAKIPWFDSVFADIGDEQSLSQSLSTFSGHLKKISHINSNSTCRSLVLLDEVGAGTNPLEGAALGMSLLESFAESALLTVATTHYGELKSLKYRNNAVENACMEFDEVNLKPTYKILWGVPGRSNAISIAERLGLPGVIINNARELHGAANAEINEIIVDMEMFKQKFQEHINEARHYLILSRKLHEELLTTQRKILEHSTKQAHNKMQIISEAAAMARSIIYRKAQDFRASQHATENKNPHASAVRIQLNAEDKRQPPPEKKAVLGYGACFFSQKESIGPKGGSD